MRRGWLGPGAKVVSEDFSRGGAGERGMVNIAYLDICFWTKCLEELILTKYE